LKAFQPNLSALGRGSNIDHMSVDEFDLAIIGGGINGAGVARDAASRGLRVALIEASDFASGTSSRSSKLIHGGIRYLENLEFHLVFEALSERQTLFEMAPHLVHPLRFLLPVYKSGRVPVWKLGLGMWVYDALSMFEAPELNQYMNAEELAYDYPALQTQDLKGGFVYYDAYMDDDRLVHETLRSAVKMGVTAANYARAVDVEMGEGHIKSLICRDQITGKPFHLRAKHFVSTVGPWTDKLGQTLFKNWKNRLRPTKGVHLTFLRERFPLKDAIVMEDGKRIVFAIPRHEMVLVGTTDTDYPGDPAEVRAEPEDIDYILKVTARYFPGAEIQAKDIVGCYAGVRPLVHDGAQTESKTSREHVIWTDPLGITFVAGGKYTTYRKMAEQIVETVLKQFPLEERVKFGRASTRLPLNPLVDEFLFERAQAEHLSWADRWTIPPEITAQMASRHGLEAELILYKALELREKILSPEAWMWSAEALHAMETTMCGSLTDFFFLRTHMPLARKDHGRPFFQSVANTMAEHLGWSEKQTQDEINALQKRLSWELASTISG
jgi:glycerol-3-phosphate dehydrogenase